MGNDDGGIVRDCDLCIIGAGYAALNALNAAAKYMKKGERVVVIDKNITWGGQWNAQYDFVRLHQPYRLFTAGDQKWRLPGRDRSYLATRREVLDHLGTVAERSASHLEIEPLFQHEYVGHRIESGRVEVDAVPLGGGESVRIRAKRLLHGTGIDIPIHPPFALSSSRVRSVGIADPILTTSEFLESDAPVFIIGSGKTAIDCAGWLAAQEQSRHRKICMILGSGMFFFVRERCFPTGATRYAGGVPVTAVVHEMAELFDGENETAVMDKLVRDGLIHDVFGGAANCRYAILSKVERETVRARVNAVVRGHLIDVVGSRMVVREQGNERSVDVPEGSWFINCTTHLLQHPHVPILRDDGLVCAPQRAFGFSGSSAYFLTHLWFRGQLSEVADRFFRVAYNLEPKLRMAPQFALSLIANFGLIMPRLPLSISARFEADFVKWYPLYRQIPVIRRVARSGKAAIAKAERLLPLRYTDPVALPATRKLAEPSRDAQSEPRRARRLTGT